MRFTEAMGRKVVSLATAETVGTLGEFVVDPGSHTVVAVGVTHLRLCDADRDDRV